MDKADKTERLANATFEIRRMDDALVDTMTNDQNGRVFVPLVTTPWKSRPRRAISWTIPLTALR